ncbi:MAG TPA: beta-(1-6) glucans synthase [Xanthobacteraceae bacterium]|nr:beta-(1-6) glucans synthase [Xanthobacteraceae bacterium]
MTRSTDANAFASALSAFVLTALAVGVVWWWLGKPVTLPPSPLAGGRKLSCVSYAPFRAGQDPLVETTQVAPAQIDADLTMLSHYTDCVRTYSISNGQDKIPEIAQRHGLKVLQGLWLSGDAAKNRKQIETVIALGKKFPDTISGIVVGNEVLLRGEMSVNDLMATIREVKAQVPEPVTYADVWEYWLRYRDVANVVDFVTIHILPYWEDFPLPASVAAAHVDAIRKRIAAAIPGKDIMIGEVGWPSAGRMREGALPSPSNQALVIQQTLALAQRENFRVNFIEAFDQPWKRWLEGSVGGSWGIFDRGTGGPKFALTGGAVSDHPQWPLQALAGILLAAATFAGAFIVARTKPAARLLWPKIAALSFLPAVFFGWTIAAIPVESYTAGGWLRSLGFAAVATAAPIVCAMSTAAGLPLPTFAALLGRRQDRFGGLSLALGIVLIALVLFAVEHALGLSFDPRYRDIPFAPLCASVVPFLVLSLAAPRPSGPRAVAERAAAVVLAAAAVYIVFNESFANWQAVWFCAGLLGLALILAPARDAPG